MAVNSTTLITGGSSGIGLELAKLLAADGHQLILVAITTEELNSARELLQGSYPGTVIHTICMDLAKEGAAHQLYDQIKQQGHTIDLLVNSAGFGAFGFINDIDIERESDMIRLNVLTLYQLNRLFLKDMLERDKGQIVNLSSISAFQSNPSLSTYGATKSFVLQFSRSIDYELREKGSKVRVRAICPTSVRQTGFQHASGMEKSILFDTWMTVTPDLVARTIYKSLSSRRSVFIPGRLFAFSQSIVRHLPDSWQARLSRAHLKAK